MRKIYFATTNEGKLKEAKSMLGIDVQGISRQVDEIQSLDATEVAIKKAQSYFFVVKKPLFVEDVSLSINELNGLPGTFIDHFMKTLGNEGILELLRGKKERSAKAQTSLAYINKSGKVTVFTGVALGSISEKIRGDNGFGWDSILIPKGSKKTFAEMVMEEKNKFSMRAIALKKLKNYLSKRAK